MEKEYPGSTHWLKEWGAPPYFFPGTLTPDRCDKLCTMVEERAREAPKGSRKKYDPEVMAARQWRDCAKERERKRQEKEEQKMRAKALAALSVKIKPDEETTCSRQRGLHQHLPALEEPMEESAARGQGDRGPPVLERQGGFSPVFTRSQRRHQPSQVQNLVAVTPSSGPRHTPPLYPDLTQQEEWESPPPPPPPPPPPYPKPQPCPGKTRAEGYTFPSPPEQERGGAYPMLEVANPNHDPAAPPGDGNRPTMRVYRPWTCRDAEEACKGLPDPVTDPDGWCQGHQLLVQSFGLNGHEVLRTCMIGMGHRWVQVKGDFTGKDNDEWCAWDSPLLQTQLTGLYGRVQARWRRRPDYMKITQCQQKDGELVEDFRIRLEAIFGQNSGIPASPEPASAYQQGLKSAFMAGLHSPLSDFIRKHNINHPTDGMDETCNWAKHAERQQKKKTGKKAGQKAAAFVMLDDDDEDRDDDVTVYYQGQMRPRGGGRGRGFFPGPRQLMQRDDRCYICGKRGHFARECLQARPPQRGRG